MRHEGRLKSWNDERGFGFIALSKGGQDVFVHISAFGDGASRPQLQDLLSFDIETGRDGRPRALNVLRPGQAARPHAQSRPRRKPHRAPRSGMGSAIGWGLAITAAIYAAAQPAVRQFVTERLRGASARHSDPGDSVTIDSTTPMQSRCDGRTRCRQMTSCEEATYFLKNCPGTVMDGDHDGVPCEDQWCR